MATFRERMLAELGGPASVPEGGTAAPRGTTDGLGVERRAAARQDDPGGATAFLTRFPLRERTDEEWDALIPWAERRADLDELAALRGGATPRITPADLMRAERGMVAERGIGRPCWWCGRTLHGGDWVLIVIDRWHRFVCDTTHAGMCVRRTAAGQPVRAAWKDGAR
jgi:hypothetical protein